MRKDEGFTLIELLIVVAIIGVIAAVAIPNMLNAIDRSKQKRTMCDMRSIATALEQYSIDHNHYPVQATLAKIAGTVSSALNPYYTKVVPDIDGWNWEFQYGTTSDGDTYTLRSFGKDGVLNGTSGPTTRFDCDIIMQLGQFTSWPDGLQS